MAKESKYASTPLPRSIVQQIDRVIENLGYWPSRASFVREACLKKIEKHKAELE